MSEWTFSNEKNEEPKSYQVEKQHVDLHEKINELLQKNGRDLQSVKDYTKVLGTIDDSQSNRQLLVKTRKRIKKRYKESAKLFQDYASIPRSEQSRIENYKLKFKKLEKEMKRIGKSIQSTLNESASKQKEIILKEKRESQSYSSKTRGIKRTRNSGEEDEEEAKRRREDEKEELLKKRNQQRLQQDLLGNEAVILEREKEINAIESDVLEISEITKELQWQARKQGEIIDNIDDYIEDGYESVKSGNKNLRQAEKHSKHGRTIAFCIVLILLLFGVIGVIIFFIVARVTHLFKK